MRIYIERRQHVVGIKKQLEIYMNAMQNVVVEQEVSDTVALEISEISSREEMADTICICSTWF